MRPEARLLARTFVYLQRIDWFDVLFSTSLGTLLESMYTRIFDKCSVQNFISAASLGVSVIIFDSEPPMSSLRESTKSFSRH